MALPSLALPGQLLGPANKYLPGPGTHMHDSQIYASISGPVTTTTSLQTNPPLLSITNPSSTPTLPTLNTPVLAQITRLTPRVAHCIILALSSPNTNDSATPTPCPHPFTAQIRREDIRATEKDKIRMEDCFRVGDLVRGVVISLGDTGGGGGYYVGTEGNWLGVVGAWWWDDGRKVRRLMVPVSWCEVLDGRSGGRERRKVARPF
ncbi:hypothetical protein BDW02DRAFT_325589 [Decorospora gaudefroyi]|uniref:Exosome complex component CSL4 C-terminal domain-containing protein n=1 Tax=Decorospora gaudefroyi TaxID=184978 RepID=A0A6A5KH08_9PLEO|nr:hypothetical protein BDW02DRAFT_325589 [Decorospora gaudefroyi]